jgi:hypothetical protein
MLTSGVIVRMQAVNLRNIGGGGYDVDSASSG